MSQHSADNLLHSRYREPLCSTARVRRTSALYLVGLPFVRLTTGSHKKSTNGRLCSVSRLPGTFDASSSLVQCIPTSSSEIQSSSEKTRTATHNYIIYQEPFTTRTPIIVLAFDIGACCSAYCKSMPSTYRLKLSPGS